MISTGALMLGKALLTAVAIMGFLLRELWLLRKMKREDAARAAASTPAAGSARSPAEDATGPGPGKLPAEPASTARSVRSGSGEREPTP